jgi:hypothetical protein
MYNLFVCLPPILRQVKVDNKKKQGGVPHYGLAIYIIQKYLKAKEELWKLKYFSTQKYT